MASDLERDVLRLVVVDSPCTADWDRMRSDDRVRFCGTCQLRVYNLSGMGQGQAAALVASREGRHCVRLFRRPDGTMVTRDCGAVGRRMARVSFTGICTFIALVLVGTAAGIDTWMTEVRWPGKSPPPVAARNPTWRDVPPVPGPPPMEPVAGPAAPDMMALGRLRLQPRRLERLAGRGQRG